MEARTQLIIALTSIITSTFTVFLGNFLAPRINAWYERKYRDGLVFKKTLRLLLEIDIYAQRNLKHPSVDYLFESLFPKLKKRGYVSENQVKLILNALPQFVEMVQPQVVQELLPDNSEALHKEFTLVIGELSTVDPLLAYKISERDIIRPIQRMNSFVIDILKRSGVEINEEDKEVQLLRRVAESQKAKLIEEFLEQLRNDILAVAAKTGTKGLREIELHFVKSDIKLREDTDKFLQRLLENITELIPVAPKPEQQSDT